MLGRVELRLKVGSQTPAASTCSFDAQVPRSHADWHRTVAFCAATGFAWGPCVWAVKLVFAHAMSRLCGGGQQQRLLSSSGAAAQGASATDPLRPTPGMQALTLRCSDATNLRTPCHSSNRTSSVNLVGASRAGRKEVQERVAAQAAHPAARGPAIFFV